MTHITITLGADEMTDVQVVCVVTVAVVTLHITDTVLPFLSRWWQPVTIKSLRYTHNHNSLKRTRLDTRIQDSISPCKGFTFHYFITVNNDASWRWTLPEKKLSVEVGNIDGVHVNHMDKAKPRQCLEDNIRQPIRTICICQAWTYSCLLNIMKIKFCSYQILKEFTS